MKAKRVITSLLIVCMLMSTMALMGAFAYEITGEDAGKCLHILKVDESAGTVDVSVQLAGPMQQVRGLTMYTAYDSAKLEYVSCDLAVPAEGWDIPNPSAKPAKGAYPAYVTWGASPKTDAYNIDIAAGSATTIGTMKFKILSGAKIDETAVYQAKVKPSLKEVFTIINLGTSDITFNANASSFATKMDGPTKIDVTDLTVAKDTVNLKMGATTEETVGVTIVPDNATDKTYSVVSSAPGVATAEVVAGGVKITAVSDGTANVTVTSTDNATAKKVIAVNVAKADPTNYTVAVNKTGFGIATVSAGSVAAGGTVDLRVLPVLGNKVSSIMMNSQDITADFNAFLGGKKTYTINENTTFTVTFASIIGAEAEKPFVAPDAFVGEYTKPGTTGAQKSAAAFGKIAAPVASNLVTEYGVKLVKDGAPYTKEVGGVTYGPKFEATSNVNDQFGVLFIGLEAGTYTATTYVIYNNGGSTTEVEGYAVTFTVQ